MDRYGRELAAAIDKYVPQFRPVTVTHRANDRTPSSARVARLLRSYQRYIEFPLQIRTSTADVHHIIDHSYGHLVHVLNPQRTVATCHDLMMIRMRDGLVPGGRPPWAILWLFQLSVMSLRRCRLLLVDSRTSLDDFSRYLKLDSQRFRVVYLGLDPKFRPPTAAEFEHAHRALGVDPSLMYVLNISTGASYKNSEGSIRTVAHLVNRGRVDVRLLRIGHPLTSEQTRLADSLGVRSRIIELGRLPEHQIQYGYWVATALLFPSYYEGFGWPILEAMGCGTPVVASDAPTIVEVGGGVPLSHPADDAAGMAISLAHLMDDSVFRAALIERGRSWAGRFTWERTAKETTDAYAEVVEEADLGPHSQHVINDRLAAPWNR